MLCLLVGEITFAPDLPQPQCGKVFRRIPILRLLLPGFLVQHPLHHPTVLGAAYALLPTGTVAAVFLCSQVSFLLSFLVVAGVCQYFSLWTDIDIFFRIIGECFRLEAFRVGRRVVWLPLFWDVCPNPTLQHGIVDFTVVVSGIRADGLCLKAKLVNLRFQSNGMGRAVIYIPRRNENICNNTRFGITGLVIQIAEGIGLSGTIHQSGLRIGGAFGDCFRLIGIGDRFIQ